MSWDLQDIGAHLRDQHGFVGEWASYLPSTVDERERAHEKDHDDPIGLGHVHNEHDPRIFEEC